VLERLSNGHPKSRLDDLLPWNWAPALAAVA
jgi:transposase